MEIEKNTKFEIDLLEKNMELAKIKFKLIEMLYFGKSDSVYKEKHHIYQDIQDLVNSIS